MIMSHAHPSFVNCLRNSLHKSWSLRGVEYRYQYTYIRVCLCVCVCVCVGIVTCKKTIYKHITGMLVCYIYAKQDLQ